MSSCLSTQTVASLVKTYDSKLVKVKSDSLALPAGITFKLNNQLPKNSSVKQSYFMAVPLIVINYFQANHKLTLGQSSLELSSAEFFKNELLCNLEQLPWTELYQKGYSIDVDVHEMAVFGVYKSGFAAAFAFPSGGSAGKFSTCKKVYSNINISVSLNKNDIIVFHRDLNLIVKVNTSGILKVKHIDNQTSKGAFLPTLPNMYVGKSLETLIPSTKKIYAVGIQEASREISTYLENYFLDFYSAN